MYYNLLYKGNILPTIATVLSNFKDKDIYIYINIYI